MLHISKISRAFALLAFLSAPLFSDENNKKIILKEASKRISTSVGLLNQKELKFEGTRFSDEDDLRIKTLKKLEDLDIKIESLEKKDWFIASVSTYKCMKSFYDLLHSFIDRDSQCRVSTYDEVYSNKIDIEDAIRNSFCQIDNLNCKLSSWPNRNIIYSARDYLRPSYISSKLSSLWRKKAVRLGCYSAGAILAAGLMSDFYTGNYLFSKTCMTLGNDFIAPIFQFSMSTMARLTGYMTKLLVNETSRKNFAMYISGIAAVVLLVDSLDSAEGKTIFSKLSNRLSGLGDLSKILDKESVLVTNIPLLMALGFFLINTAEGNNLLYTLLVNAGVNIDRGLSMNKTLFCTFLAVAFNSPTWNRFYKKFSSEESNYRDKIFVSLLGAVELVKNTLFASLVTNWVFSEAV